MDLFFKAGNIYNTPLYTTMNVYRRIYHFKVKKKKYMVKNIFFMQILIYWSEIIALGLLITREFLSLGINTLYSFFNINNTYREHSLYIDFSVRNEALY